jgi:hypothetical protein
MAPKLQQVPRYTFRVSKTHSNIRVRECQHCKDRTRQKQAQDWAVNGSKCFFASRA